MRQSEKQSAAVAALLAALSLIASRKLLSLTIAFGNNATRMLCGVQLDLLRGMIPSTKKRRSGSGGITLPYRKKVRSIVLMILVG